MAGAIIQTQKLVFPIHTFLEWICISDLFIKDFQNKIR